MTHPLRSRATKIAFDKIETDQIRSELEALLMEAQAEVDVIATRTGGFTYDNTLGALEAATESLEFASTLVGHLESVRTTDALRNVYNEVRPKVGAFFSSLSMNTKLYAVIRAFAETDEAESLDAEERRFLKQTLDNFRRNGAELPEDKKKTLSKIEIELTKLTTQFSQQLLDATNDFELLIEDESQLAGLPESARMAAKQDAEQKGKEGWRFTLQAPSLTPLLTYLDDRTIREHVWSAYNTRATHKDRDNRILIEKILDLRAKKAALLGYADFSDFILEDRMAASGKAATDFVEDLRARTHDAFVAENVALQTFVNETAPYHGELAPWDIGYFSEKERKARFDFDEEELRPYFPLERVLKGLFEIVQKLYGIKIETWDAPTWHQDVRTYAIRDKEGLKIAAFYADLFPREDKRGGAWMNQFITGAPADGRPHVGLICANVNPPLSDRPALLTHREVETLFHEFGHLLHHCLTEVRVRSLAGTNVAWDFVELPSQIMENWCWEKEALDLFARHYESGDVIPDALFEKLTRARTFRAANAQMRQLGFAAVDLGLHRGEHKTRNIDAITFAREVLQAHSAASLPDDYAMIAGFGHLFASPVGYAAGYYSYKWAEVLDADAFSRFRKEGITNPSVGRAFREAILSKGDARDPAQLFFDFMGRGPDPAALMRRAGLAADANA